MRKLRLTVMMLLAGLGTAVMAADFNGDGTNDVGIFRPSAGLWSIQNVTRTVLGSTGDEPVPGDYNADGKAEIAVFRPSTGLWSVQNVTRAYLGSAGDAPLGGLGGGGGFWLRSLGGQGIHYLGNVAIGEEFQYARLAVAYDSDLSYPQLQLDELGDDYARMNFANSSGGFFTLAAKPATSLTNARMNFYYYATGNLMTIRGDGNVGIGNEDPGALLTMETSDGGYYSATDHQWHNGSSRKIKDDIRPNEVDVLKVLDEVKIVNYRYNGEGAKEGTGTRHIGFIAEEAPDLLTGKNKNSMATGDCIGFLLAVVKEQKSMLQEQQKTIAALEGKVASLEQRVK